MVARLSARRFLPTLRELRNAYRVTTSPATRRPIRSGGLHRLIGGVDRSMARWGLPSAPAVAEQPTSLGCCDLSETARAPMADRKAW